MQVAVIGGGISGIAAAFYLMQRNIGVDIFESEERLGGRSGSAELLGRRVDFGGKNVGKHYHLFREFTRSLGDPEFEYFGINTSQLVNGRIVSLSKEGAKLINLFKVIRLSGMNGVVKLYPHIKAILNDRSMGVLDSPYFRKISEQFDHITLAEYVKGRCVENLVRPITIRMNGAEPEECYPGNFGSNLALAVDSYDQLNKGMHGLLDSFTANHTRNGSRIFHNCRVTAIHQEQKAIRLEYLQNGQTNSALYDRVIAAVPAYQLAPLLETTLPKAAELLHRVNYFPVGIGIAKYRNEVFTKNRRAMIFDRNTPLSNAGAYGLNDLNIVRYTFSGKASRAIVTEHSTPEKVIELGEEAAYSYFNLKDNQREAFVYRYFSKGLCAYSDRHHLLLDTIDRHIGTIPFLGATGDYRRGASIEACFKAAKECVDKVTGDLF